jgi:hypothetical protein
MDEFPDQPDFDAYTRLLAEARQIAGNSRNQLRHLCQRYGLDPRMLDAIQAAGIILERQRDDDRRRSQAKFNGPERRQSVRRSS